MTFIEKAQSIHGDTYDYSKVEYVNNSTNVKIVCKSHGTFKQLPKNHLVGKGCPDCAHKKHRMNRFEFIRKSKSIHGKKYTYQKASYKNNVTPIVITCREHGDFEQLPKHHLVGKGCPACNSTSTGESMIAVVLDEHKIKYQQEYPLLRNPETGCFLRADFYIEELNTVIEFDGPQHFQPVDYFGGEEHHYNCIRLDAFKNAFCKITDINLIRIPYFKKNEIRDILEKSVLKMLKTPANKAI